MTPTPLVELRTRPAAAPAPCPAIAEARADDRHRGSGRRVPHTGTTASVVAGTAGVRTAGREGRSGAAPDDRRDDLVWRSGRLELRFRRSADRPVMLTRLVAGSVETHFAHPVPLVEVLVADRVGSGEASEPVALGADLRYVAHSVSADGATLEIVSATPDGIRAAVTLHGRDGAVRSSAVVTNGTGAPVRLAAVTGWAVPLGVRLDKGDAPDPAADWVLVAGRAAGPGSGSGSGGERWAVQGLREADAADPSHPASGDFASGTSATGDLLPVAALVSDRQEVAWMWEVAHDGPWRWVVGAHAGDRHLALTRPADRDGAGSAPLAPGASSAPATALVAVGTDLEDAAAAMTRARRAARADAAPGAAAPAAPLADPVAVATAPLSTPPEDVAVRIPALTGLAPEACAVALATGLAGGLRVHDDLDGIAGLAPAQRDLIADAARAADDLREGRARALPLWPLGLPAADDRWVAVAHDSGDAVVVTVWDRGDDAGTATLAIPSLVGRRLDVAVVFPRALAAWDAEWDAARGILTVGSIAGGPSARVLELRRRS
ncbi:hypothetical protein [Clavibacter zhangzhiyongii]|uniref:hypothetical protein n=1 Tax=Clavibacter zhangzhiyongii TaxID=2768071 RepID=UPI0039E02812